MSNLSQEKINVDIEGIQLLHGRYSNELCNILKRHNGSISMYDELISMNNIVGKVINILYDYRAAGNTEINDATNNLTEQEMTSLINYCYKVLNKYNSNVFLPTDPNVYL